MLVTIDITLRGTRHDPLPMALHNTLRDAFEQEEPLNLLTLPAVKIVSFEHALGRGEWSLTLHAEGRSAL